MSASVAAPSGTAVASLLLSMADDEFVIGSSDSEWTGIAPILEEDVAMSSLAQDEIGHAAALYALHRDLTGADPDATAYDRPPDAYRHARLLDHGRGDWAMTIARRYLYETADAVRLEGLASSSWSALADLVGKLQREERYHRMHVDAWLDRLAAAGGEEPRARLRAALTTLAPDAGTVFTPLPDEAALVAEGILDAPMRELERRWRAIVDPVFARHRLAPLPDTPAATDGRTRHGAAFDWLWGEFAFVRRSDPGATW